MVFIDVESLVASIKLKGNCEILFLILIFYIACAFDRSVLYERKDHSIHNYDIRSQTICINNTDHLFMTLT